ncbi:hypothetical protein FISHEDRAFT_69503 [Fistulina hepatica ATCC 64428]|uniref:Coenzyme Q-binding protein COQ10 START domain-containing protein n=1 Tax=Fistulina hepatica ATCC 64428 TaxID=1128425 RepID=A0A0D7AM96_9AGAR|nr:hypothetical protein FISHEDRAFT_69503 [Fistulina hepatica ATCC 64428]
MSTEDTSHLPPRSSDGVFTVSASIIIDRNIDQVWEILTDSASYRDWNSFVRNQVVVDGPWSRHPLADQTLAPGRFLYIYPVHLPPTFGSPKLKGFAVTTIKVADSKEHRLCWATVLPRSLGWLLKTERWQALSTVGDGTKTKYETFEVFSGPLAYIVKFFLYNYLAEGFRAMAEGLKNRCDSI